MIVATWFQRRYGVIKYADFEFDSVLISNPKKVKKYAEQEFRIYKFLI